MNKSKSLVALFLGLLLFACSISVASQTGSLANEAESAAQKRQKLDFVPGEILVRFRNEVAAKSVEGSDVSVRSKGRSIQVEVEEFKGSELVEGLRVARVAAEDTLSAIEELSARTDVLYAEPNYVRRINRLPNDPRFSELWGLKNNGGPGMTLGADIDAAAAWDTTTGDRNVVVGVVDEGIDINHQDLKSNIWANPAEVAGNGIDDDSNGFIDDVNGWDFFHNDKTVFDGMGTYPTDETDSHGTHVAGTIGAAGNNSIGVVGVNWQVSLMSLKILGRENEGVAPSSVLLTVQAYNYAKMMRELWNSSGGTRGANIRVLNNSYGGSGRSQAELDAIKALGLSGILFVASSGNKGGNNDNFPHYPSSYEAPNLISVASTDFRDFISHFSNYGPQTVNMAAPGERILSTTPNNTYSYLSGTSMATPHVSGAAALVCAAYPNISMQRLRAALLYSGEEIPSLSPTILPPGVQTGRRLNALNALKNGAESDMTPPSAVSGFRITAQTGRSVTLGWTAPGDDGAAGRASLYELRYSDTDVSTGTQFTQATVLTAPATLTGGATQSFTVKIPYRHTAGFIAIRAVDNAGNVGAISRVGVSVPLADADPYIPSLSSPGALSTGGTPLGLVGDDKLHENYHLPFTVPFFSGSKGNERLTSTVAISTNGAIYLSWATPRGTGGDDATDSKSSVTGLNKNGYTMIAGLWDDLRTDRRAGDDVYVVQPDADRIIFRWQAVTFDTPLSGGTSRGENPVSFEIEMRRDGTIQLRYGAGNTKLFPVVGISGGEPDAYVVASHTSEHSLKSLTNAGTVIFTPRNPPPPSSADLSITNRTNADFVTPGQLITYTIGVSARGPDAPPVVVIKNPVPAGTAFVSCEGCNPGSPIDKNGAVSVNLENMGPGTGATIFVKVKVTAQPGASITSTATVSSSYTDPNPADNVSTSSATKVLKELVVATPTFSPDGGSYDSPVQVRITCDFPLSNVTIYYTTNGQEPTRNDQWTSSGATIWIDKNMVLKAKAFRDGWTSSSTKSASYTITPPLLDKKIAFTTSRDGNSEIYLMGADGGGPINISNNPSNDFQPAWSPDGKRIAFVSDRLSAWPNIFVMWADGTHPLNVTNNAARNSEPVWSPDGTRIAFTREDINTGKSQIYIMNSSGSNQTPLTNGPGNATSASWSPDGEKIAFVYYPTTGNPEVYVMNAYGSNHVRLTNNAGRDINPVWSPDGKKIAFASNRNGNYEIYSMDADGANQTRLTNNPALDDYPSWSADGNKIVFHSDRDGGEAKRSVYIMNTDGTNQSSLSNGLTKDSEPGWRLDPAKLLPVRTVAFSSNFYTINEGAINTPQGFTSLTVTVNRSGDTSAAATVQYFTSDTLVGTECDQVTGDASQRCDYAAVAGTLRFAAGQTTKQIQIPIIKDGYREGDERFLLTLKNPTGASLGTFYRAVINIQDSNAVTTPAQNPYVNNQFFVRMNYLDFLGREPDVGGWSTWPPVLNSCGSQKGFLGAPPNCDRSHVSHGFFGSPEFTDTGFLIYRMYEVGLGRLPRFTEFTPDMASLSGFGLTDAVRQQNLSDYLQWFTEKSEFNNRFRDGLQPAQAGQLILMMEQTAGVTLPATATTLPGQPPQFGRAELIQKRASGQFTLGQTLKAFVEQKVVYDKYFPRGQVTMLYFAYLKRDPSLNDSNLTGWKEWVHVFTNGGADRGRPDIKPRDIHHLIFGFIYSEEYRKRFGAP